VEAQQRHLGAAAILEDEDIAKISIVGVGMRSHSGVAARMFEALAKGRINIELIATSEIKISVVIRKADADRAVQALHKAFGLGRTK
jgi:aspartate kinase